MNNKPILSALACLSFAGVALAQNVFVLPGSNSTSNTVLVYSSQFIGIGNVVAGNAAFQILAKPDGSKYYIIANSGSQTVTVVDSTFLNPRSLGNLGSQAVAAAITPDGRRVLVLAGSLHVFDTTSDTDLTPNGVLPGTNFIDLAVSQDGSRAFLLATLPSGGSALYAVDLNSFQVVGNLLVQGTATNVAVAPNSLVYVGTQNQIVEVNPATLTTTPGGIIALNALPGKFGFTPDGKYLLSPNQTPQTGSAVLIIDLTSRTVANTVPNFSVVLSRLLVAGNNLVYAYSNQNNSLYQFSISSPNGINAANLPTIPNLSILGAALSNDVVTPTKATAQNLYVLSAGNVYRFDIPSVQVTGTQPVAIPNSQVVAAVGAAFTGSPTNFLQYGDKQSLAQGATSLPLVIRALDASGNPLSGVTVTFASSVAGLGITNPTVTTGSNGYASTTITAPLASLQATVTATAGALSANFTLTIGSGTTTAPTGGLQILAGNGQVLYGSFGTSGGFGTPLLVQVTDVNGNPVAGTPVTFTLTQSNGVPGSGGTLSGADVGSPIGYTPDGTGFIVNTDANGKANANYLASSITNGSGFNQSIIQASAPGANSANFYLTTIPLNPGPSYRFSPDSGATFQGGAGSTIANAVSASFASFQGQAIPNIGIRLIVPPDPSLPANTPHTISPAVACVDPGNGLLTDSNGLFVCNLRLIGAPGRYQFSLEVGNSLVSQPYNIVITPGAPAIVKIVQGDKQSGAPGQQLQQAFAVTVQDAAGNLLVGAPVAFSVVTPNTITLKNVSSGTDQNGRASALGTLGSIAGTYQVKVTSGTGTASFSFTINVPTAGIQPVSGGNQTAIVNTPFGSPLVVKVVDANGAPVANAGVSFSVTQGSATVGSATATTDSTGQASTTVTAGTSAGPIVVIAASNGFSTSFGLTSRLPGPTNVQFVNGASFQPGISPGAIVNITGVGLLPGVQGLFQPNTIVGPLPTSLQGFSITFNGVAAPIYFVSNQGGQEQVTIQVPFETVPGNATVGINAPGGGTATLTVPVQPLAPGIFETVYNGQNFIVATRPDGSYISPSNPAMRGEAICFSATGLGQTTPALGTNTAGVPNQTILSTLVAGLNNNGVQVTQMTTVEGKVGVYQVCMQVPIDTTPGPRQPVGLILYDGAGNPYFAPSTYVPIQ